MEKEKYIESGILIAANELDIEPVDYAIDYRGVLKDNDISGLYDPVKNLIILNSDWLNEANNNEILLVVFHEMRHVYQKIQIDLLRKGSEIKVDKQKVKAWESEFSFYTILNKSNIKLYTDQLIEKDAIDFSKSLLNKVIVWIS